ncbi:MAG: hypothetical protein N3A64_02020, partial [Desulfobacterota bacterium]|nr:hypothetical protein [Thermodesulfobacteriota bacterium]
AVGVPLYMGYVRDAKAASAQATIGVIANAEKLYHQFNGIFVNVADLSVVPNPLNIDVRDAAQYWNLNVSGATVDVFTVTATGKTGTEYEGIVVTLNYNRNGDEVWTRTDRGTPF